MFFHIIAEKILFFFFFFYIAQTVSLIERNCYSERAMATVEYNNVLFFFCYYFLNLAHQILTGFSQVVIFVL